jgi:hypothetical protein
MPARQLARSAVFDLLPFLYLAGHSCNHDCVVLNLGGYENESSGTVVLYLVRG